MGSIAIRSLIDHLREPGTVYLDTADLSEGRSLLFTDPVEILQPISAEELRRSFVRMDEAVLSGRWVAGFLTYEAGETLVLGSARTESRGLAWLAIYDRPPREVEFPTSFGGRVAMSPVAIEPVRSDYARAFARVKHFIHEGDVYQINLTGRGRFRWSGDPVGLYASLRRAQPVPFAAWIRTSDDLVLSLSPELFFHRNQDVVTVRPMKGTAARHPDPDIDMQTARVLRIDPKNRAENLMIVDLLRNDLSVVCHPGTVETTDLFTVNPLPTVWQMTSQIQGRLRAEAGYEQIFSALFPSGSITGAPKRRAMEIIREVEETPRGIYCGAIGFAAPNGEAVFSVAIRTIALRDDAGIVGSGGGIVWDADVESEFDEMLLKTKFVSLIQGKDLEGGFHLIETMRATGGVVPLLEEHLSRLEQSCRYLDIEADYNGIRLEIIEALRRHGEATLRLSVYRDGRVTVVALQPKFWPDRPLSLGLAPHRVRSTDPFLYLKSSRRSVYDEALIWAEGNGYDEPLLLNERGELTEGARTNLFVKREEVWQTPRISCGLLPGVGRKAFMERHDVEEITLRPSDLADAQEIVLTNALRGPARAVVEDEVSDA